MVDKEVLPRRQDPEGGWNKDEELAHKTLRALLPSSPAGLNDFKLTYGVRRPWAFTNC